MDLPLSLIKGHVIFLTKVSPAKVILRGRKLAQQMAPDGADKLDIQPFFKKLNIMFNNLTSCQQLNITSTT